jgi:hypothetical protein
MDIPVDYLAGRWITFADRLAREPARSCGSQLERRFLAADLVQQYCLFIPSVLRPKTPVLVAVHGANQTAMNQIERFAPLAEAAGILLAAPVFVRERFPHYQRLGRAGNGLRADLALDEILRDIRNQIPGSAARAHLFGHAGGAQFVHRYVMARPSRVERYAVSAARSYTHPDPHLDFPFGTRPSADLPDLAPEPRAFLAVPGCVFGSAQGPGRSHGSSGIAAQGVAHIDRGRRWAAVMNRAAGRLHLPPPIRFTALPGLGPIFGPGPLAAAAFDFLFRSSTGPAATRTERGDERD